MKNWPQSNAKPYTPETWDKDPSKWEKWNRPRIEATLEALAAEAATLPIVEQSFDNVQKQLAELQLDYERVLHELKAAAKEVASLTASRAAAVNLLEMEQEAHLMARIDLGSTTAALHKTEAALVTAEEQTAVLEAAQQALAASLWNLREAVLMQGSGVDPVSLVKDRVYEAGEVLKAHRPKRK